MKSYYFFSLADMKTRKNVGVVMVDAPNLMEAQAKALPVIPEGTLHLHASKIGQDEFEEHGFELGRFYTAEEMVEKGYGPVKIRV